MAHTAEVRLGDFLIDPDRLLTGGEVEGDALLLERTLLECSVRGVGGDMPGAMGDKRDG